MSVQQSVGKLRWFESVCHPYFANCAAHFQEYRPSRFEAVALVSPPHIKSTAVQFCTKYTVCGAWVWYGISPFTGTLKKPTERPWMAWMLELTKQYKHKAGRRRLWSSSHCAFATLRWLNFYKITFIDSTELSRTRSGFEYGCLKNHLVHFDCLAWNYLNKFCALRFVFAISCAAINREYCIAQSLKVHWKSWTTAGVFV